MKEISGQDGALPVGTFAIVASRYNTSICNSMVAAARQALLDNGVSDSNIRIIRTPGAWELTTATQIAMKDRTVIGVIALGCVIRGETSHDEHINRAVSLGLMELSIANEIPLGLGLLTCNTLEQAIQRSGGTLGNKGAEAAEAVVEMLRLAKKLVEVAEKS
jgi:6,7-dimethyl-8-ribityllumazine synthase